MTASARTGPAENPRDHATQLHGGEPRLGTVADEVQAHTARMREIHADLIAEGSRLRDLLGRENIIPGMSNGLTFGPCGAYIAVSYASGGNRYTILLARKGPLL